MAINKISLTDVQNTLQSNLVTPFELTSYADDTSLSLASSRAEEIGNQIYRVESGDFAVTDSASDGIAYVYVADPGSGVATATLLNTVPTFDPNKGGWYSGTAKACFIVVKAGTTYSNKYRLQARGEYVQELKSDNIIADSSIVSPSLTVNSSTAGILGSVTALSIDPYLTGSWSTYKAGNYLLKIGKIVLCQFSITGSSTSSTCFTGIPSALRPTAETRILGGDNVVEAGMFIVNTDGTINPPGNGASTYYTTGSGFWKIS